MKKKLKLIKKTVTLLDADSAKEIKGGSYVCHGHTEMCFDNGPTNHYTDPCTNVTVLSHCICD